MAFTKKIDAERRAWIERQERFADLSEEYDRLKAVATPDELPRLMQWFGTYRQEHRRADELAGKRGPGLIAMHRIMWATWLEVAVDHELLARQVFTEMAAGNTGGLGHELRASLVCISACAHAVEALYGDLKYRVPPQKDGPQRHQTIARVISAGLGLGAVRRNQLFGDLGRLFDLRDDAVHPYTEAVAPTQHPLGFNTGIEHSLYNAVTCQENVDAVLRVLADAFDPPAPTSGWVSRWSTTRRSYFEHAAAMSFIRSASWGWG